MLDSSWDTLNRKRELTLQLLDRGVPYLSHLLKFYILSRYLPLLYDNSMTADSGSLDLMVLEEKGVDVAPYTVSW